LERSQHVNALSLCLIRTSGCLENGGSIAWKIVEAGEPALIVINPSQFEVGPCCVITRRHVATLLDPTDEECGAVMVSARRVADALVKTIEPLGILTFQNNGELPLGSGSGRT
jgi:diadenosine tetraphosphate (Ap4A) HIT family hydrolase